MGEEEGVESSPAVCLFRLLCGDPTWSGNRTERLRAVPASRAARRRSSAVMWPCACYLAVSIFDPPNSGEAGLESRERDNTHLKTRHLSR